MTSAINAQIAAVEEQIERYCLRETPEDLDLPPIELPDPIVPDNLDIEFDFPDVLP